MKAGWTYAQPGWGEGEIDVTLVAADPDMGDPAGVNIAVSREHAMDSYNQTFTCYVIVPPEKLDELIDFLQRARDVLQP